MAGTYPLTTAPQMETAQASATSLIGLIDDILDASKMEAGKFVLTPQPASLRELAEDVTSLFGLEAARKGIRLALAVADTAAPRHMVDPLRFKQILNNLVPNASRFTEQGEPHGSSWQESGTLPRRRLPPDAAPWRATWRGAALR